MTNTPNTRKPVARAAKPATRVVAKKAAPTKTAAKPAAKTPAVARAAAKPAARVVAKRPVVAKTVKAVKPVVEAPKRYKVLTGIDDHQFCARISEALDNGYELYGSPAATFNGKNVILAQAIVLKKLPAKKKSGKKK